MTKLNILILFTFTFSVIAFSESFNAERYIQERKEKDIQFKTDKDSPIPDEEKPNFNGLSYFPPNKTFIFAAKFTKFTKPDTVKMLTSKKEKQKLMLRYGTLSFKFKDKTHTLNAFVILPAEKEFELFIPFTDVTTGYNTYEAGRYLDIPYKKGKKSYFLDFNQAYNPYCAFNKKYSCPLVPSENHIPIEIQAGEKYEKKSKLKK